MTNVGYKCLCLSHGFRKFEELLDFFPKECITVMKMISQVYQYEEETASLNDKERLEYHQTHSQPVMEQLKAYISQQLDERRVEPNSELGKAMKYMLKHWHGLTQFLRIEGADLDNNIVERALKIAIRN